MVGLSVASKILGWKEEDVIGKPLHDIHHHTRSDGTHYPKEECPIYAAIKDGKVHQDSNEVFWHSDGHCVPVEYTSTPIRENDVLKGAVVIFRDISERKNTERTQAKAFAEIKQLKTQLEQERDYLRDEIKISSNFGEMIGSSQAIKRTQSQVEAVASTSASVLILGESGVGKELIARAIHEHSERADKPLVKVNCASIPKDLFESEFFGHVKGAFTGAHRNRIGRMQLADGGTLFLDEVGEIPIDQQGKLLRALQENAFEPVGDEQTINVNVRIVAATNRDLMSEVKAGRFREDLYYRLSVFPIDLPPLRNRVDDIGPLAQHFLKLSLQQMGRNNLKLNQAHLNTLKTHQWPGNIRELKNVIERAVILSTGNRLLLNLALPNIPSTHSSSQLGVETNNDLMSDADIRSFERTNTVKALKQSKWKISDSGGAAELLGLKPSTLAYRIEMFKISKTESNSHINHQS
ncbi:MAG: sigma 54-interacting transcriptional regulator [Cycloclasticus sp.]|nr:sigma 54-interacting transcriptional regulator [Cycloclasticus sp.]